MKKILLSVVSTVVLSFFAMTASADNLKVGVVDMQQILQKAPQITTINEQLTKQFKPRQDKIVAAQKTLQDEINNLNKNGAVMNVKDRNKLQDKVIQDRSDLQGTIVTFQRDLSTAQNQSLQSFNTQLNAVVGDIAKKNMLDIVIQRASTLYAKDSLDVTKQVLDELSKK